MLNGSKQGYGLPDTIDNNPGRAEAHGAIPSASKISAVTASPQLASSDARTEPFDHLQHAREARLTAYLPPVPSLLAYLDWALHLANVPARQLQLMLQAGRQWMRLASPRRCDSARTADAAEC